MHITQRKAVFVILAIVGFLTGRFYKEVEVFFNTPYSLVGILTALVMLQLYYIIYLINKK